VRVLDFDGKPLLFLSFLCPDCQPPHYVGMPLSDEPAHVRRVGSRLMQVWQLVSGSGVHDITLEPEYRRNGPPLARCGLAGRVRGGHWQ
jgi:hypothetical protein